MCLFYIALGLFTWQVLLGVGTQEASCAFEYEEASSKPLPIVAGVFGAGGWTPAPDGSRPATDTLLNLPRGIAVDPSSHLLYIADTANHVLRLVDLVTGAIPTLVGTVGQCGSSGDYGPAAAAQLCQPHSVALDSQNRRLYISDSANHAIRRLDLTLGTIPEDRIHVADNGNYVNSGTIITVVGQIGIRGRSGDGGPPNKALLNFPAGVALDQVAQKLYVADSENHVVRLVDLRLGVISTIAGVLGMPGGHGDGGPAVSARMRFPMGVAFDPPSPSPAPSPSPSPPEVLPSSASYRQGLYVADSGNHIVRRVELSSGVISTIAGMLGVPGTAGDGARDGGPATAARLRHPGNLALDAAAQQLYVAGSANPAVRRVDLATGAIFAAVARPGLYASSGDGGPVGLALDQVSRKLYMAEAYNHVVRYVDLSLPARHPKGSVCP